MTVIKVKNPKARTEYFIHIIKNKNTHFSGRYFKKIIRINVMLNAYKYFYKTVYLVYPYFFLPTKVGIFAFILFFLSLHLSQAFQLKICCYVGGAQELIQQL